MTRAERQHREVVHTTLAGDVRHAADLRREHLLEFPGDVLIVWLPVLRTSASRDTYDGLIGVDSRSRPAVGASHAQM